MGSLQSVTYRLGGASDGENATVEVNNVLVTKELHNVFGIIKGFTDPGVCVCVCVSTGLHRRYMGICTTWGSVRHPVFMCVCLCFRSVCGVGGTEGFLGSWLCKGHRGNHSADGAGQGCV